MQVRNVLKIGVFAALVSLASCNVMHEMQGARQDLKTVQQQLVKIVGNDKTRVILTDDRHLSIDVVNSPLKALPAAQKNAKALEIARLAYASYPLRTTLTSVGVAFVVHRGILGVLNYSDSTDAFSFDIPQLTATNTSVP